MPSGKDKKSIADDGMDWLSPDREQRQSNELDSVASAARAALHILVRHAFGEVMAAKGVTRRDLAERLSVSVELVSRLLRQPTNMTVETAAKLLFAMGRELRFEVVQPAQKRRVGHAWLDKVFEETSLSKHDNQFQVYISYSNRIDKTTLFLCVPEASFSHDHSTGFISHDLDNWAHDQYLSTHHSILDETFLSNKNITRSRLGVIPKNTEENFVFKITSRPMMFRRQKVVVEVSNIHNDLTFRNRTSRT